MSPIGQHLRSRKPNRLTRTRISSASASDYLTEYTWDHRNRLTQVTFKNNTGTVTKRVSYDYDVFDRRIAKDVDSTGDGTFERGERYVYDGEHIAMVFDHTGALLNRYTHNPQHIDQVYSDEQFDPSTPGEMPTAPGDVIWPLADNQGTPRDLAEFDDATGITAIANHRVFDSFGRLVSETDPTVDHAFDYTGRELDADTGLMYYRARWYDPAVGRFISEDPMKFEAGDSNLNRYVLNAPTILRDPSGLQSTSSDFVPLDPGRVFTPEEFPDFPLPILVYPGPQRAAQPLVPGPIYCPEEINARLGFPEIYEPIPGLFPGPRPQEPMDPRDGGVVHPPAIPPEEGEGRPSDAWRHVRGPLRRWVIECAPGIFLIHKNAPPGSRPHAGPPGPPRDVRPYGPRVPGGVGGGVIITD
jgi:RHS repeat-associated protein